MHALRRNLSNAFQAMFQNWLRTSLTTLGILIGVGSVVLLVSIGQGVREDVAAQIEGLGTNTVIVVPGKLGKSGEPNMMATLGISSLTTKDIDTVASIPEVEFAVPLMFVAGSVEIGANSHTALVVASHARMAAIGQEKVAAGRFFTESEHGEPVCVLADEPAREMFGTRSPIGKTVQVKDHSFRVIGVMEPTKPSLFAQMSAENIVYLPFEAAANMLKGGQINRIFFRIAAKSPPLQVVAAVNAALKANHGGKEDFGVVTQKKLLDLTNRLLSIVQTLLVGISAISLVVAGIGIMNIMLVTVTERTREIGIRKTVGATRKDIFVQFLTEAVTISFAGGGAGTLLAVVICYFVGKYTALQPLVTWQAIALAFGVCLSVGLVFGVAPAVRASRQDPIDALRYE